MSAGNRIVNVRLEDGLFSRVEEEVQRHNEGSSDAVWTTSDYVRKALLEKIAHADRSRKKNGEKRYECIECGQRYGIRQIGYVVRPLFGKREYTCLFCQRIGLPTK